MITRELVLKLGQSKNESSIFCLNLSGRNIEEIEGLEKLTKLKELNLSINKIKKLKGLENTKELKDLNASNNMIQTIEGIRFPYIKSLNLSFNKISKMQNLGCLRVNKFKLGLEITVFEFVI